MKKHIKSFFVLLSIYFSLSIFSLNLLGADIEKSVVKDLCSKGIFKKTLRSYGGELCEIKLLGYIASKICKETVDFNKSKCFSKIKTDKNMELLYDKQYKQVISKTIEDITDLLVEASPYLSEPDRAKIEKRFPNISLKEKQVTPGGQKEPEKVTLPKPESTPVVKPVLLPVPKSQQPQQLQQPQQPLIRAGKQSPEEKPQYLEPGSSFIKEECEDLRKKGFSSAKTQLILLAAEEALACPAKPECEKLKKELEEMKASIKKCFPEESKGIKDLN